VICDTTFLIDFRQEVESGMAGPARTFMARHRSQKLQTTVISVGELSVIFRTLTEARAFFAHYHIHRLTLEIAYVAASLDRELMASGQRLGENDNWIAGFCRYYRQPLVSRDDGFDRVRGLRRLSY